MKKLCQISIGAALALVLCLALLSPRMGSGQVENGTIKGRVTDPSGAVVPGAAVTVTQRATGLLLRGQTNNDGTYGHNAYGLAALTLGIAPGNYFGQGLSTTRGAGVAAATNNFETNGGIGGSNEILLDGVSIVVCCQGQPAVTPTLEILGQFKVLTSDPPAAYGHTSGGILNIVTTSGTNQLHGDVYEFFRNDALDAANFFTKRSGIYLSDLLSHAEVISERPVVWAAPFPSQPVLL